MKSCGRNYVRCFGLAGLLALAGLVSTARAVPWQTDVFVAGQDGYHTYRIPAIVRARNGDLLAICEGRRVDRFDAGDIDLVMKRSTDGGHTWGALQLLWNDGPNTCGNPCPVVDETTGAVLLVASHNLGRDHEEALTAGKAKGTRTVWLLCSNDNGHTWSVPQNISAGIVKPEWGWYATGPGVSIQLQHGPHAGRLVVPCDHSYAAGGHLYRESNIIYSDDHGGTWHLGGSAGPDANECQVAELSNPSGGLLINMRSYAGHHCRLQATSIDGGLTWTAPADASALVEPTCQAGLLRWDQGDGKAVLLFSNPADAAKRRNLTVRASLDDGCTWPQACVLNPGPGAYSCLVAVEAKIAGCLYECGSKRPYDRIVFAGFTLADLTPVATKLEK